MTNTLFTPAQCEEVASLFFDKQRVQALPNFTQRLSMIFSDRVHLPTEHRYPSVKEARAKMRQRGYTAYQASQAAIALSQCMQDAFPGRILKTIQQHPESLKDVRFNSAFYLGVKSLVPPIDLRDHAQAAAQAKANFVGALRKLGPAPDPFSTLIPLAR